MPSNIDVLMAEVRKFADRKPVHAVAGATVVASRTLRELPGRLVQWTRENPPNSLPGRATEAAQSAQSRAIGVFQTAQSRANEAVQTAQSRGNGAVQTAQSRATGIVQAAQARANGAVQTARAKASDGYDTLAAHGKKAIDGQSTATQGQSAASTQSKPELNGKAKAKAPTRPTTGR
jgi:cell division septum initiation protein DivIVA